MLFIDFIFYFSALHFKKINNGISWARPVNPAVGARNFLFLSTFIWVMIILNIINYLITHKSLLNLDRKLIYLIALIIIVFFHYIYIEKKRFIKIYEREQGYDKMFQISEKKGITIAIVYIWGSIASIFIVMLIRIITF